MQIDIQKDDPQTLIIDDYEPVKPNFQFDSKLEIEQNEDDADILNESNRLRNP